jgi:hypothetical protein
LLVSLCIAVFRHYKAVKLCKPDPKMSGSFVPQSRYSLSGTIDHAVDRETAGLGQVNAIT